MKHLFIPYELAVIAKEKGFNEPCLMCFYGEHRPDEPDKLYLPAAFGKCTNEIPNREKDICAPLYQQIIDWFREKHNIKIVENPNFDWEVWAVYDDKYIQIKVYLSLDECIKEAFKLI